MYNFPLYVAYILSSLITFAMGITPSVPNYLVFTSLVNFGFIFAANESVSNFNYTQQNTLLKL